MSAVPGGERNGSLTGVLSTRPTRTWPDGVLYHGARILLLVLLSLGIALLFPPVATLNVARYDVGTVVEEDVIARVPFAVPKSPEELERDRAEAAASVPPTFQYRPEATDSVVARLERFFLRLDSLAGVGEGAIREALGRASIVISQDQTSLLAEPSARGLLERTALEAARNLLPMGVMDASQTLSLTTDRVTVRESDEGERQVDRDEILTARGFYDRAVEMLPATAPPDLSDILRLVLIRFMEPTYTLDPLATDQDKDAARRSVPTMKANVLSGEAIVRANQQVGEAEVERLEAYQEELRAQGLLEEAGTPLFPFVGAVLQNVLLLGVFGLLLLLFRPEIYRNVRWILLFAFLTASYFVLARVVAQSGSIPLEAVPLAFVALAVAVLWDGRVALVLGATLAVLTGLQRPFSDVDLVALAVVETAAAALGVRAVRRRVQAWVFGAGIAAANVAFLFAAALVHGLAPVDTLSTMAWAGGSGILSAVAAMGFLPLFEKFTGITTDQTLLEWADPNQALLKRLSLEAPGTYAHTIQVANLAEAAANAIGANGLLCRVGAYYHDVGKMLKPQYFVENQPGARNPHDKLKPSTSASIVREHVTEGLRLARDAGAPRVILDFIPEHHGTQKIGFFLEKAREEDERDDLELEEFRYPGPRPRSRETAIAMMADSVESATRALQDPTPERIRSLIGRIVEGKIQEGQLDEAPLTLREVAAIKEQFAKVLGGVYHHRLDYPATKDLTTSGAVQRDAVAAAVASRGGEGEEGELDREAAGEERREPEGARQEGVDREGSSRDAKD